MTLLSFSLSHRTAPVDVREAAARSLGSVGDWLRRVRHDEPSVAEAFIISTCHRFEFYVVVQDVDGACGAMARACGLADGTFQAEGAGGWRVRRDADVAVHLSRVASGLDSLVVGEAEIAGQVRRAVAESRAAGALGPLLEVIVAGAYRASGRVRSETLLSRGVTSAASAGVLLAAAAMGTLSGRHVLVIGAGQAARTALGRIGRAQPGEITVASRSQHHAAEAAALVSGHVTTLDEIDRLLPTVDVVVAATNADAYLLNAEQCAFAFAAEAGRRRVCVDLSVPRVIDPAVAMVPGVTLVSVDDLGDVARQSTRRREREIPLAEEIARVEGAAAFRRMAARESARRLVQPLPARARH